MELEKRFNKADICLSSYYAEPLNWYRLEIVLIAKLLSYEYHKQH
jgi:hypothetical protein